VAGGKHAEVDVMNFAKQNGLTLHEVGAMRFAVPVPQLSRKLAQSP
jgi:hypothetical protein